VALLGLLVVLIVLGLGFITRVLLWAALGLFALWALGWVTHSAGARWYRW
jgi:hypothetical protein